MNMKFYVNAKLLSATSSLLLSGYLAFALSTIAVLLKAWQSIEFWIFIVVTFILVSIHHYLSYRIKFDAQLIEMMAHETENQPIDKLTQQFDQTLLDMGLISPAKIDRTWSLRFSGCFKLLKLQITLLFIQYFVLIVLIYRLLAQ